MSSFGRWTRASEVVAGLDLSDRHVLLTGAASGIGFETAVALASAGAKLTLPCRSEARGREVMQRVREKVADANLTAPPCDLGSVQSVRDCVANLPEGPLHAIIANAGVFGGGYLETVDGFERVVGVSHIGHFVLVTGLLERLVASAPARVVMVASESHQTGKIDWTHFPLDAAHHSDMRAYDQAKLCNVLFANELDRRYRDKGVRANSLHPGTLMSTGLNRQSWLATIGFAVAKPFTKNLEQGASTQTLLAVHPSAADVGGEYWSNCAAARMSRTAQDAAVAERLWEVTEKLVS